jgi:hypothetical protein
VRVERHCQGDALVAVTEPASCERPARPLPEQAERPDVERHQMRVRRRDAAPEEECAALVGADLEYVLRLQLTHLLEQPQNLVRRLRRLDVAPGPTIGPRNLERCNWLERAKPAEMAPRAGGPDVEPRVLEHVPKP